jgi:beta-N-acetylhexosaminidase
MSAKAFIVCAAIAALAVFIASSESSQDAAFSLPAASDGGGDPGAPGDLGGRKALGQMIVARFTGTKPTHRFLARIRRGEVGGVIFFEENLTGGEAAVRGLLGRLQRTARAGDNPPLLLMLDQEGGTVKRLPGPPTLAPRAMASTSRAAEQGEMTGEYLAELGFNVDLAPLGDVGHPGTFLGSRAFGSTPGSVARRACAFAAGLAAQGVVVTLKHFPGLGWATANTDEGPVTVTASLKEIRTDYAPYRLCGSAPLTLVMVSSAVYPALTGELPAVLSPRTYNRELPAAGVRGVTISDDLESPPIAAQTTPARRAINAGLNLLLYASAESTSVSAYQRLLSDLRNGRIDAERVQLATAKILALKASLVS